MNTRTNISSRRRAIVSLLKRSKTDSPISPLSVLRTNRSQAQRSQLPSSKSVVWPMLDCSTIMTALWS